MSTRSSRRTGRATTRRRGRGAGPARPADEIEANGWDLNIGRYIKGAAAEVVDVATALAEFAEAQAALREAEERLAERLPRRLCVTGGVETDLGRIARVVEWHHRAPETSYGEAA